jgi:diguanylate cyclase (GGDEF)-like protein
MNAEAAITARNAGLLQRIAAFTDERDLDMLERSMLLTVREILQPAESYLFRHHETQGRVLAWRCSADGRCESGQSERLPSYESLMSVDRMVDFPIPGEAGELGRVVLHRETPLSEAERRLIDGLLRIYRNFLSVLEESQKDKLTGLFNRRTFEARFQNLLDGMVAVNAQSVPSNRRLPGDDDEVWLAMVDIDNFKRINDTYGHLYGDEVLILVARFMRSVFRDHDLLFRFGGEEFAVLLQAPDQDTARRVFERFRQALADHVFPQVGQVTTSIGVTAMSGSEPVPAVLIGRADSALYYAKGRGKNRVVFEDELPDELREGKTPVKDDIELF